MRIAPVVLVVAMMAGIAAGCIGPASEVAEPPVGTTPPPTTPPPVSTPPTPPPARASLVVERLILPAEDVVLGRETTVSLVARNLGNAEGEGEFFLLGNDVALGSERVALAAGETREIPIAFAPRRAGDVQLQAVAPNGEPAYASLLVLSARMSDISVRNAENACETEGGVTIYFWNTGRVDATNVTVTVKLQDRDGTTREERAVPAGDVAAGQSGSVFVEFTRGGRCSGDALHRLDIRVAPRLGEGTSLKTPLF